MKKLVNDLYKVSRAINKTAAILKDIDVVSTGDIKKISNHFEKRAINKLLYDRERKANNTITKKIFGGKK